MVSDTTPHLFYYRGACATTAARTAGAAGCCLCRV